MKVRKALLPWPTESSSWTTAGVICTRLLETLCQRPPPSAPHCAFFIFTTWGIQSFLSASNSPFVFLHSTWTLFTGTLLIKVMPPTHHQVAPYRRRLGGFLLPNTPSSVLTPYFFLVRSLDFYPILFQAKTKGDSKNHA